jgi:hypothetical protein
LYIAPLAAAAHRESHAKEERPHSRTGTQQSKAAARVTQSTQKKKGRIPPRNAALLFDLFQIEDHGESSATGPGPITPRPDKRPDLDRLED